jgi:hypothetical protein
MPARRAAKKIEPIGASAFGLLVWWWLKQFPRQNLDDGHNAIEPESLIVRRFDFQKPRFDNAVFVAR